MGQTAEAMEVIMVEAVTTAEVVTTAEAVTTAEVVITEADITVADITVAVIEDASAALLKKSNVYDPNFGGILP